MEHLTGDDECRYLAGHHLYESLRAVRRIPDRIDRQDGQGAHPDDWDDLYYMFFMHARTLAEFFRRMPRGDVHARTLLPCWQKHHGKALDAHFTTATKFVAHMSMERVRFPDADHTPPDIAAVRDDCVDVAQVFAAQYATCGTDVGFHETICAALTGPHTGGNLMTTLFDDAWSNRNCSCSHRPR